MLSIGPYVVVREIPTRNTGTSSEASGKTFRATDRLTGIPVLLHALPTLTGVPRLPMHPALLPFTDIVVHAGEAYLVTELPANAVPAREPLHAARGALMALNALHERGLVHGSLNTAQLWSVDGPVRLAGGGRHAMGDEFTVVRDLSDLATTLDDLGGLPPSLSCLRTAPERLTAREALQLLHAGEAMPATRPSASAANDNRGIRFQGGEVPHGTQQSGLPNLDPLSLLNPSAPLPQTPSFVSQAVLTSAQELTSSHTDAGVSEVAEPLPFKLDISQWDVPDFDVLNDMPHAVASPPPVIQPPVAPVMPGDTAAQVAPAATISLGWANVNRPLHHQPQPEVTADPDTTPPPPEEHPLTNQSRKVKAAASQALQRLKTDAERLRHLQEVRRDTVAAQLGDELEQGRSLEAVASGQMPVQELLETPQERRRREHAARVEEETLASKLMEVRGPAQTVSPPAATAIANHEEQPWPARQTKAVKLRWDEKTNSWQKVDRAEMRPAAGRPGWIFPAVIGLALVLGLAAWGMSRRTGPPPKTVNNAPAAASQNQACCTVEFKVSGGSGRATISILNTTSTQPWKPGQPIGEVPGQLRLPGKGVYKLNVASEGLPPKIINDLTVPTSPNEAVTINLGQ